MLELGESYSEVDASVNDLTKASYDDTPWDEDPAPAEVGIPTAEALPAWKLRFYNNRLAPDANTKPYDRFFWSVLSDAELDLRDKLVAIVIWKHATLKGMNCYPAQELIAWLSGCQPERVRRATRKLERRGFLETVPGTGKTSTRYTLLVSQRTLEELSRLTAAAPSSETASVLQSETPPPRGGTPLHPEGADPSTQRGEVSIEGSREVNQYTQSTPTTDPHFQCGTPSAESGCRSDHTEGCGPAVGVKQAKKKTRRHGEATFEFDWPSEVHLSNLFWVGCPVDTRDEVRDSDIRRGLVTACDRRIGQELLTDEGVEFVRYMMGALIQAYEISAQEALGRIEARIRETHGATGAWLNSYRQPFLRLLGEIHEGGPEDHRLPHRGLVSLLTKDDPHGLLSDGVLTVPGIAELRGLMRKYGDSFTLTTVVDILTSADSARYGRHFITGWSQFENILKSRSENGRASA
jgi:hypothetical protein